MAASRHRRGPGAYLRPAITLAGGPQVLVIAGFYTAAINFLALTGPAYMLVLYDRVLPSGARGELLLATAIMLGLYALGAGVDVVRQRLIARAMVRLERKLSTLAALYLTRSPARELGAVRDGLGSGAAIPLCDLPFVPLYLAALALLHPLFGLLALAGLAVVAGAVLGPELSGAAAGNAGRRGARGVAGHACSVGAAMLRAIRPALQSTMLGLGAYLVMTGACHSASALASAIILPRLIAPTEGLLVQWRRLAAAHRGAQHLAQLLAGGEPQRKGGAARRGGAAARTQLTIVVRRGEGYARNATRGAERSASSVLRPTAQ